MAQEPGVFSVRRPRETLGALTHNNGTAIPMPSSALKRSNSMSNQPPNTGGAHHARSMSGSRMSLAPGRPSQPVFQRSSSGTNLAEGLASANRNSTSANIFGGTGGGSIGGRKSYAPANGGIMATPASTVAALSTFEQSTQRRSSIYRGRPSSGSGFMGGAAGGQQSFFTTAPAPAGIPQDPRRLRDVGVRQQMAQELVAYLTRGNFEMDMKHSLSHNSMTSPTQKDFNCMFQWLYHRIDPAYRFQKNIDAEVPPLLKQMRYPFEKNIMKSQIAAVGGNNWPTFLGLLHWMMQLSKLMEQYAHGTYDDALFDAGLDVGGDRIIFDFLSGAYSDWLQTDEGDEDDDPEKLIRPHVETMAARFDRSNEQYIEQVKILEAEHKALQDQIEELSKTGPKIAKLDEQIKILEDDKVKFEQYNDGMEARIEKYKNRITMLESETAKADTELSEAEREKAMLQEEVDRQGISVQDIDRMNTERERLQKGVEATNAKLEEGRKRAAEREADASRKLDELERMVEKYNSLAYQIGVVPSTAPNAKGQEYELTLTINEGPPNFRSSQLGASQQGAPESASGGSGSGSGSGDRLLAENGSAYQPHHVLSLDLRGTVRNNIAALRKEVSERRNAALEADMQNHDLLDKIKEAMDDKQAEVEALGHRVRAAEEEFEKTREITTAQKMASDAQIEKMEKELAKMRAGLSESVQLMEQREMNTNIEYEQLTLKAAALREELHTEIERMLNDIIKFKVHVQKSLEDYEQFVAEEVEKECEEQENGVDDEEEPDE